MCRLAWNVHYIYSKRDVFFFLVFFFDNEATSVPFTPLRVSIIPFWKGFVSSYHDMVMFLTWVTPFPVLSTI